MTFDKREDKKLKFAALKWLRLDQRCPFIATEVGAWAADVIGINEKKVVEIEVKIDASDLRGDFKKNKHSYYNGGMSDYGFGDYQKQWYPTHFYFCVPERLVNDAKELIEKHKCEKYGVIQAEGMKVVKRAKWLHEKEPNSHIKFVTALRMGSELIRFHEAWL